MAHHLYTCDEVAFTWLAKIGSKELSITIKKEIKIIKKKKSNTLSAASGFQSAVPLDCLFTSYLNKYRWQTSSQVTLEWFLVGLQPNIKQRIT